MTEKTLVILAAGMGSRFGDKKQLVGFGPSGQLLPEYSIYDAVKAGFERILLIIQEKDRPKFDQALAKVAKQIPLDYAYQSLLDLPAGMDLPEGRVKPWGTAHALRSARHKLNGPFAIINADDYYGPEAFKLLYDFLEAGQDEALVLAYDCLKTLSDHGSVTRGILNCEGQRLKEIVETGGLERKGDVIVDKDGQEYPLNVPVSMNSWAFKIGIFEYLDAAVNEFFKNEVAENPLKAEIFLPSFVGELMAADKLEVKVLPCREQWYGVTHAADREKLEAELLKMHEAGQYPAELWQQEK
ncbi:MAG: sugar phosphate nucleotidyltransferase [Eubacteriales bacterium]|nr:sugar phosphate nucleotidyltransferase [Eubacteriales bacterium]